MQCVVLQFLSALTNLLPVQPCSCSYDFIGNDCCSYVFSCEQVGLGTAVVTSDVTIDITMCVQPVQNCTPCTSGGGGCSGTITYTDSGSTSVVGSLQAGLNNALKTLLGPTFNVSAEFSAGSTTSTSISFSESYSCNANPGPCQGVTCTQKIRRRMVAVSAPINSQTFVRTTGIRPDANAECVQNPDDCPVDPAWTRVGTQQDPCYTGSVGGTGSDDVSGVCMIEGGFDCPEDCDPCPPGINLRRIDFE